PNERTKHPIVSSPNLAQFVVGQKTLPCLFAPLGSRHPSHDWRQEIVAAHSVPVHYFSNDGKGLRCHSRATALLNSIQQPHNLAALDFGNGARAKDWINVSV